tara:strand:+ start:111 stop:374 length:264 start_codon:yes stop_codon:yes gene_type:complete
MYYGECILASIHNLNEERSRRDGPDPEHVFLDDHGQKWYKFVVDYEDVDRTYSFIIWAHDMEDAQRRLALIKDNSEITGQIYTMVDA